MHQELDSFLIKWMVNTVMDCWKHGTEPNFIDVICKYRGWSPMEKEDKITISYDDKEYKITRTK
jgi:hypothetical protein